MKRTVPNRMLFAETRDQLLAGREVVVRVLGQSMLPFFRSGSRITLRPLREGDLRRGHVVLGETDNGHFVVHRILTVGAVLGNVGFFGLPLVTGLFPDQPIVACYSTMYITSMNFLVFTLGVFFITQKKQYVSLKAAILNPTTLAVAVAILRRICRK